jgi:hypothetical protein
MLSSIDDNTNEKGRASEKVAKQAGISQTNYLRGKKIIEDGTEEEQKEKLRKDCHFGNDCN